MREKIREEFAPRFKRAGEWIIRATAILVFWPTLLACVPLLLVLHPLACLFDWCEDVLDPPRG